jgi:RHS repeat-associated protein
METRPFLFPISGNLSFAHIKVLRLPVWALAIWFSCCIQIHAAEIQTTNSTQEILQMQTFREGLVWTGNKEPGDAENLELLEVLKHLDQPWWTAGVEQFLKDHPNSPWAASLRHDYASFCRRTGRTTKALEQWEAAWALVKNDTSPQGKQLGGAILGNWTDLLSSLGRLDELKELIAAGDQWHFINPGDRDKFQGAKNSYYLMQAHPGIAYRCGTFALKAVGEKLQPDNRALEKLIEIPSPTNGFSMATLLDTSKQYGLNMVAVRRPQGQDLIVPSVVHWRQNHYAAILDHQDNNYLVSDPTFGHEKWMSAEAIDEEASGEFLVPAALLTNGWTQLARNEIETVHGMGLPNNINDANDKGCKPGGPCPPCTGMPIWWVSEPYVNLWIADEPLSYLTSRGEPFTFRTSYKQRDTRPGVSDPQLANTGWNHSWLSFIHLDSALACPFGGCSGIQFKFSDATVYLPSGGAVYYPENASVLQKYDQETRLQLMQQGSSTTMASGLDQGNNGMRLVHSDGSQDIYGFGNVFHTVAGDFPSADFYLTRHIDPHGNTSWFYYTTTNSTYVLQYVVDYDGRTNTLKYTSNGLLLEVDNPYGLKAQFKYDANKNLTNIVDAAGLSSSLTYDTNGYPTSLVTPYGTNQFSLANNGLTYGYGNAGGDNVNQLIDRSALIVDPTDATNLYIYRYDSALVMSATNFTSVPTNTPLGTLDNGTGSTDQLSAVYFRNSFHWGPRQYANLSTGNMTNFTANDYMLARLQHWLQDTNDLYITDLLSVERDPSPSSSGSIEGLKTFYDYQGKIYGYREGTNALPAVKAWCLPGGETHYEYMVYDSFGNLTNDITTYTLPGGSLGTRTNQFIYATNIYVFTIGTVNSSGNLINTATTSYTAADLLTKVIRADGITNWAYGGFDTVTWTNYFYTSTQTNGTLLTAFRVLPDYATNGLGQVVVSTFSGGTPITQYNINSGQAIGKGFTGYNKITSTKSVSGLTTTNIYNANGFLAQTIDLEISRTNSFGYISDGLIGAFTNELGLNVAATWDNLLRLTAVQFPDSTYISNRYDKLDLGGTRDRLGNWTTYGHDGARHLTAVTNANNAVTMFDWCGCGSLTEIIDPLSNPTSLSYDNQGNLTGVSFPDSSSIGYQYDLAARRISATDGASRTWLFGYDNQGLVTVVSNAYGRVQGTFYDIRDRQVTVTNADGVVVTNSFDPLDRTLTRTWPNGATEGFGYSAQGLAFHTNQLGQVCRYGNDVAMRKTSETNANNEVTLFTYDAASGLLTLKDGKSQTTTWTYDLYGNVSNKVDAAANLLFIYKYDPDNRLTNRWSAAKANTIYKYDPVGNLTNIAYPVSVTIALSYDPLNRLTNMVDAVGTTAFSYSQVGQLLSENGPWANDTVSYTYAQRLRTALSLSQPSGSWSQSYGYDSARRLTSLTSPAGAFGYGYFAPASLLPISVTLPNSAYVTNTYDNLARLLSTKLVNSSATVLDAETYAYDAGNERTQAVFTAGNFINYGYDMIGQLKTAIGKESGGTTNRLQEQLGYAYDAADNLNTRTNNALIQTFNVNSLNELTTATNTGTLTVAGTTTIPAAGVTVNGLAASHYADATFAKSGFTVTNGVNGYTAIGTDIAGNTATNSIAVNLAATNNYTYDLNGNLTSDGKRGFDYDDENELIRVTVTNNFKKEYVYDGKRRLRIRKEFSWGGSWVQTNEIHYVYDGNVIIQHRDTNNVPTLTFTRGLDLSGTLQRAGGIGGLLALTESSGTNTYYHSDGIGNVMMLINTNQLMVAKYEYDPFGNPLSESGPKAFINPYWFSSQLYDPDTGFSHYRFRVYVPELQRWLNRDPIEENGGINLYRFVGNNPVNRTDFFGLEYSDPRTMQTIEQDIQNGDLGGAQDLLNESSGENGDGSIIEKNRKELQNKIDAAKPKNNPQPDTQPTSDPITSCPVGATPPPPPQAPTPPPPPQAPTPPLPQTPTSPSPLLFAGSSQNQSVPLIYIPGRGWVLVFTFNPNLFLPNNYFQP